MPGAAAFQAATRDIDAYLCSPEPRKWDVEACAVPSDGEGA
jgi:hypothetical protein